MKAIIARRGPPLLKRALSNTKSLGTAPNAAPAMPSRDEVHQLSPLPRSLHRMLNTAGQRR